MDWQWDISSWNSKRCSPSLSQEILWACLRLRKASLLMIDPKKISHPKAKNRLSTWANFQLWMPIDIQIWNNSQEGYRKKTETILPNSNRKRWGCGLKSNDKFLTISNSDKYWTSFFFSNTRNLIKLDTYSQTVKYWESYWCYIWDQEDWYLLIFYCPKI